MDSIVKRLVKILERRETALCGVGGVCTMVEDDSDKGEELVSDGDDDEGACKGGTGTDRVPASDSLPSSC
jgi:hypothetical protein